MQQKNGKNMSLTTQESNTKIVIICFCLAISLLVGKLCVEIDGNAKQ